MSGPGPFLPGPDLFLGIFLMFCRIGGCLLVVPGVSSARIPVQVRLFLALSVTFALSPLILPLFRGRLGAQEPAVTFLWILSESLTGFLIGLLGRVFLFVLETVMTAVTMAVGFGTIPGTPMEGNEPQGALVSLVMVAATALLFSAGLHWELFRGLVDSYARLPPGEGLGSQAALVQIVDQITSVFVLGLRITSPFIVYSIVVNLAVGFANKLTPTIPVYFIATPFVMVGGILMLYLISGEVLMQFLGSYAIWLRQG
ncbi:flagellar biosynthesis protein FliR [Methylobacterium sp. WSM2598]|uniref:flagellar biosynthesis protein FliR n=1 Tax=Methylobacterium sp. WSM2598 TaxID=398261 RepID=UPI0003801AB1|nr:flagellar biosynthesis protein FliR [Methylobacterium sp. WSM2598]